MDILLNYMISLKFHALYRIVISIRLRRLIKKKLQLHAQTGCQRILNCGHLCGGIKDETKCLPCLHGCASVENPSLKQDADDMCMICFTDALSAAPSIQV